MKRNKEGVVEEELCFLPPEMLCLVAEFVVAGCEKVDDYLHFHASCMDLWLLYTGMDEQSLLTLFDAKIAMNKASLLRTFSMEYKNNIIQWTLFDSINENLGFIKYRIKERFSQEDDFGEDDEIQFATKTTGFVIHLWEEEFRGTGFRSYEINKKKVENLGDSGLIVMNALATRVSSRLNGELFFQLKKKDENGRHVQVTFPLPETHFNVTGAKLCIR